MKTASHEKILFKETLEKVEGVRIGKISKIAENGQVLVNYPGNGEDPLPARVTTSVKQQILRRGNSVGREVLLAFENNDPRRPVIIDTMHSLLDEISEASSLPLEREKLQDITVDGKHVTFDAKEEIVLRCGKASITLTRAGKVLIRGAYLLSRSSGTNRIKGGSVQIN
jgi:hypothetical protein